MVAVSSKDRSDARVERIVCPSRIADVVVYARGAVITRRVEVPADLPPSGIDLVVEAITPLADPGSFRLELDGAREAIGVVTELEIPEDERNEGALQRELTNARRELNELEAKRARLESRRSAIAGAQPNAHLDKKKGFAAPDARTKDALEAQALLGELEGELDEQIVTLDRVLADHRKTLVRLETEAAQREGSAVAKKHHPELRAVIRLAPSDAPIRSLLLSYGVIDARWWPTYAVHLTDNARRAELFVEALVAQATFEDWRDVNISLSTADMIRDVRLPDLTSLRLGRAQPAKKRGFREPPPDLDQLFRSFDDALSRADRKPAPIPPALHLLLRAPKPTTVVPKTPPYEEDDDVPGSFSEDITGVGWDEMQVPEQSRSVRTRAGVLQNKVAGGGGAPPPPPAPGAPMMVAQYMEASSLSMPALARSAGPAAMLGGVLEAAADGMASLADRGPARSFHAADPTAIEPADAWLDFDSLRLGDPSDSGARGRLIRISRLELVAELREEIRLVDVTSAQLRDPLTTRGEFDHRYDAEGTVEVPANGRAHRVSLMRAKVAAKPRFVTVPRKVADVFREVELINPLEAPLLVGPVDVMMDGALLTTTALEEPVDRGGGFAVGLGVEERVRVARNVRVRETSVGMLSTGTAIDHQVTIDLVSGLGHGMAVEVLERIPITDDKTVKIELIESTPSADPYDQKERGRPIDGGLKWKVALDPGGKRTVSYTYRIELPAKSEIQGGNRRE